MVGVVCGFRADALTFEIETGFALAIRVLFRKHDRLRGTNHELLQNKMSDQYYKSPETSDKAALKKNFICGFKMYSSIGFEKSCSCMTPSSSCELAFLPRTLNLLKYTFWIWKIGACEKNRTNAFLRTNCSKPQKNSNEVSSRGNDPKDNDTYCRGLSIAAQCRMILEVACDVGIHFLSRV